MSRLIQLFALLVALAVGIWVLTLGGDHEDGTGADLILTGARVWTGDAASPWAEVVADPADPLALVVAGSDDGGTGPSAWS